jgi:two-component system CheB/CheR fusion protein
MTQADVLPDSAGDSDRAVARPEPAPTRIVGIGASAGGLESLEQLFKHLPADTGMAFVVVQHLSPDFRSMMDELMARYSEMPVHLASDGMRVEPNRIYLLPPRKEMIICERRLMLTDKDPLVGLSLPIDQFFRSLAQDCGPQAVAVVLSGSGSDGSRGILDVKRAGGLVMVESPVSAKFDGMPLSAQATGTVDHTCVPRDIARVLCGLAPLEPVDDEESFGVDAPIEGILRLLRDGFGIDFSLYKASTVARRIQRRVDLRRIESIPVYLEQLRGDPAELSSLYQDLLIGVTQFFRDLQAFETLEHEVIPALLDRVPPDQELRVWIAGCATGEEAYSLAMLFYEAFVAKGRAVNMKILATDVHHSSLEFAGIGIYGQDQLANVSPRRLERFFTKKPSGYQISQDLRQLIVFARHNVTKDAPFTKMHFISCRNMLIYLQPDAQRTVLSLFHFGLASNGVLFLGSSESPGALTDEFTVIDERWKIYSKRRDVQLLAQLRLPLGRRTVGRPKATAELPRPQGADPLILATYDQLLDRYMPPSLLVDEDRTLVDSFGGAERLLKVRRRRPSNSVLDLLDGELRTVVAGALQRVFKDKAPVRYTGVRIPDDDDGGERRCNLSATVYTHPRTGTRHVLVAFEDATSSGSPAPAEVEAPPPPSTPVDNVSRERLETLETELAYTRETLQATIEELETSNEEMQATNEELVASNEELQSTNEELHSVNEELFTVNAESQQRILELRELNADIQHLLEGTDVGTVFLDHELRIRRYTARIASVFRFVPHDVGRQISDFSHNIDRPNLMADIERVLRTGATVADEVRDRAGTTYFLRILPYRVSPARADGPADEGAPVGAVLTVTDISSLDKARSRLAQLSAIVESSDDAIVGKTLDGVITTWNRGAEKLYGYTAEEAIGRSVRMLLVPGSNHEFDVYLKAVARGEKVEHAQEMRIRKDGSRVDVSVTLSPIYDRGGAIVGVSAIARDITPLVAVQRALEEREERIRLILDSTAEAILGLDRDGVCTFCNPAAVRVLGYRSADELIGRAVHPLIHHTGVDGQPHDEHTCHLHRVYRDGIGTHVADDLLWRADGSSLPVEYWSYPVKRDGMLVGAVVTFLDITDRRRAEDEVRTAARRREQFLAMLSHELRNPLAAVLNAIKVMQQSDLDGETLARCQAVVERQARHMARLLDDLLDVSRVTRGKFELRKEDLDLRGPITAAVESAGPKLEERKVRLELTMPEQSLPVRGDASRLQQVVLNLLTNAANYSAAGSRVAVTLAGKGDVAELRVIDQGMGIDRDMLGKIFELFVQAEQPHDRALGGLGVGLSLARSIVELHAGSIEAHSEGPGRGSEFVVRIPLQRHALRERPRDVQPPASRCRIVLVEDQIDEREMLRIVLERRGHVVLEAVDGHAAVELVEREHPDVALIDIGLPGMSGYDVARAVRGREHLDDVVLVALTGYGAPADIAASREAGFDEHVIKPAELSRIEGILARCKPA